MSRAKHKCFFSRFANWIKSLKLLPKEVESYCKKVLDFLSKNSPDFWQLEEVCGRLHDEELELFEGVFQDQEDSEDEEDG